MVFFFLKSFTFDKKGGGTKMNLRAKENFEKRLGREKERGGGIR